MTGQYICDLLLVIERYTNFLHYFIGNQPRKCKLFIFENDEQNTTTLNTLRYIRQLLLKFL